MSMKASVLRTNKHFSATLHKSENPKISISTQNPFINNQIETKLPDALSSLLIKKYNDKEISLSTYTYILKKFGKNTKTNFQRNLRLMLEYSIESGFLTQKDKMFLQKKRITN
jgi:hypothetical protein